MVHALRHIQTVTSRVLELSVVCISNVTVDWMIEFRINYPSSELASMPPRRGESIFKQLKNRKRNKRQKLTGKFQLSRITAQRAWNGKSLSPPAPESK